MLGGNPFEIDFYPTDPWHAIGAFISIGSILLLLSIGSIYKIFDKPLGPMVLVVNITYLIFCLLKSSVFIYKPPNDLYCKIMQTITQVLLLLSVTWSVFFSHSLYTVMKAQSLDVLKTNFRHYTIISGIITVVFGITLPFTDFVVYSGETCVHIIKNGHTDVTFTVFTTLPMIFCCGLAIFWYVRTGVHLKRKGHHIDNQYLLTLLAYPGIIIVCVFPAIVLDVMNWFGTFQDENVRTVLGNLFMLTGAMDAFVYGLLPQIREYWRKQKRITIIENKDSFIEEEDIVSSHEYLLESEKMNSPKARSLTPRSRAEMALRGSGDEKKRFYFQSSSLS